jgi:hypothetical protein
MLLCMSALMLALTVDYFLVKRATSPSHSEKFGVNTERNESVKKG